MLNFEHKLGQTQTLYVGRYATYAWLAHRETSSKPYLMSSLVSLACSVTHTHAANRKLLIMHFTSVVTDYSKYNNKQKLCWCRCHPDG